MIADARAWACGEASASCTAITLWPLTTAYTSTDTRLIPGLSLPAPTMTTSTSVANDMAATLAAELSIALSSRAALVPEMRAHSFGGRFILRAGVALRWFF